MSFIAQTIYNLFFYSYVLKPAVHENILEQYLQHYKGSNFANSFAINFYDYLSQSKPVYTKNFQVHDKDVLLEWLQDPKYLKRMVNQLSNLNRKFKSQDKRYTGISEKTTTSYQFNILKYES